MTTFQSNPNWSMDKWIEVNTNDPRFITDSQYRGELLGWIGCYAFNTRKS